MWNKYSSNLEDSNESKRGGPLSLSMHIDWTKIAVILKRNHENGSHAYN